MRMQQLNGYVFVNCYWNYSNSLKEEEKADLLLSKEHSDYQQMKKENETMKRKYSSLEKILQECLERLKFKQI